LRKGEPESKQVWDKGKERFEKKKGLRKGLLMRVLEGTLGCLL